MSSAEDADDERESPAPTIIEGWVDPKSIKFTVFIVLPNDEVCTLRDLPSGISIPDLKVEEKNPNSNTLTVKFIHWGKHPTKFGLNTEHS